MSAVPDIRDRMLRDFDARAPQLAGAGLPWLAKLRRAAIEQFALRGLPTRKDEDWKYTDLSALIARPPSPGAPVAIEPAAFAQYRFDGWLLPFVDGRFVPEWSALAGLPDGVQAGSLAERLQRDPQALESVSGRRLEAVRHGVAALNLAFAEDGAMIEVAPGVQTGRAIEILWVTTGAPEAARHLRHVVRLGEGARATIIETHVALGPIEEFCTGAMELMLAPGATLAHYRLVHGETHATRLDSAHVTLDRDSRYDAHAVTLDGRLTRHEVEVALAGEGAECGYNGLALITDRARVDTQLRIEHQAPRTVSQVRARGIVDGEARAAFSGRVVVCPGAAGSDAAQTVRHLLLSPRAEADSRPQLEIYADDVKCAHGAATGSLDPDQLFYLRSRGIAAEHAREMLVYAFAADALARIPEAEIRRRLRRRLGGELMPGELPEHPAP